jgi:hypothetical protein
MVSDSIVTMDDIEVVLRTRTPDFIDRTIREPDERGSNRAPRERLRHRLTTAGDPIALLRDFLRVGVAAACTVDRSCRMTRRT